MHRLAALRAACRPEVGVPSRSRACALSAGCDFVALSGDDASRRPPPGELAGAPLRRASRGSAIGALRPCGPRAALKSGVPWPAAPSGLTAMNRPRPCGPRAAGRSDERRSLAYESTSGRWRIAIQMKAGAPKRAATTPRFSSTAVGSRRTPMSAKTSIVPPRRAEGARLRAGS